MADLGAGVNSINESTLMKGQLRKLNALRKSVGDDIGTRAFTEWLASQAETEKADKNIETIVNALWPLVKEGKLKIQRSGYLVRRGRGRLIVEPAELTADAKAHDAWFRAKVQEALDDPRPAVQHEQVMTDTQALIDGKRHVPS